MRYFLLFLLVLFSCNKEKAKVVEKSVGHNSDSIKIDDWQSGFGLSHDIDKDSIWNRPVRFYVESPKCDSTAIQFYFGKYRPTDEPETARLLSLVTTDNDSLRPFYRWILNKTIIIQDGALGEYTGVPARKYAEKFPKEFFEYMDYDKSGDKYLDWTNSILYSGFYEWDDYKKPSKVRKALINKMNQNCINCNDSLRTRFSKFAIDCFPD